VTALRWAALLRQLGFAPFVATSWTGRPARALLALHAQKSAAAVSAFAAAHPDRPIVVLLAGTDIYPEFRPDAATRRCLGQATRIVALQPEARSVLPPTLAAKVRVIPQSATAVPAARPAQGLRACVLAHLRPVKDPLLPARAVALLPPDFDVQVTLAGRALAPELAAAATAARGPRFRWLGELPRRAARELLAQSHLCLVPSLGEGGANVVSEAIAAGTPVLASAIPGNTGLLGSDWPGLFPPGDAAALAELLRRAAVSPAFLADLRARTAALQPMVAPAREREALRQLLAECSISANL
jgi:putative glycosyltransferase (TIGR04348 family)